MRSVLAFGDSNTRGYIAGGAGRYPRVQRWSYLLERLLAPGVQVIEEGLNGRTTVFDEVVRAQRSGAAALPMLLETHAPLAAVIIMLGTNDMKLSHQATAEASADGMERLVQVVKTSEAGEGGAAPAVVVVAPPPLGDMPDEVEPEYRGGGPKSRELAGLYAQVAKKHGCAFLDAGRHLAPDPVDGVHIDAEGHRLLAEALAPILIRLLR